MKKHAIILSAIIALMAVVEVSALGSHRSIKMRYGSGEKAREFQKTLGDDPMELNFTTRIDHFNGSYDDTFLMRYLVNDQYYNATSGPILFYAGNEGDIWNFYNNSGFVTETLAKQMGAKVVFAEHRYYGTSMPFVTAEASFADVEHRRFLSIEQVMWDYIELIKFLKDENDMQDRAVIAFGGSYGGMLAAWLRMKYPLYFQGAIASSAPILWFEGMTDPSAFTEIASNAITKAGGQTCYDSIKWGFFDLVNIKHDSVKYADIDTIFNICANSTIKTPEDVDNLIGLLSDSLGTMAMVNYPYATSFINPLPAWPIAEACYAAGNYTAPTRADPPTDPSVFNMTHISQLMSAAKVFYDYPGTQQCLDLSQDQAGGLDASGWNVQSCSEFPMPMGDDPAVSCFTWDNWDKTAFIENCNNTYQQTPKFDWALDFFGGRNPSKDFASASNIVFSNGDLDPWHAGGVTKNITSDTIALFIKDSAHHLDLRLPDPADGTGPGSVTEARLVEAMYVKKWVEDYQNMSIQKFEL